MPKKSITSTVQDTVPDRGKWRGVPGKYRIVRRKGYTVKEKKIEICRSAYTVPEKVIYIRIRKRKNLNDDSKEENVDVASRIESGP